MITRFHCRILSIIIGHVYAGAVLAQSLSAPKVQPEPVLQTGGGADKSLAFSPDGRLLATSGSDGTVRLWDLASQLQIRTLSGGRGRFPFALFDVAFNTDGRFVTAFDYGNTGLRQWAWEVSTGRKVSPDLPGLRFPRVSSARSPGPTMSADPLKPPEIVSPDGKTGADFGKGNGPKDENILLRDISSNRRTYTLVGHKDQVHGLAFSPDGRSLVSIGLDETMRLWDVGTGQQVRVILEKQWGLTCLRFSPDGRWLAAGAEGGKLWLFEVGSWRQVFQQKTGSIWSIDFSPDSEQLATAELADSVYSVAIRKTQTGSVLHTLVQPQLYPVTSLSFSPDGNWLALGSSADWGNSQERRFIFYKPEGAVQVWNLVGTDSPQYLSTTATVSQVAFSPDGRFLGASSFIECQDNHGRELQCGDIKLWTVTVAGFKETAIEKVDVTRQSRLPGAGWVSESKSLAFSPDGSRLAVGTYDDWTDYSQPGYENWIDKYYPRIRVLDLLTRDSYPLKVKSDVLALAFIEGSKVLLSGHASGKILVWDWNRGVLLRSLQTAGSEVRMLLPVSDSRLLASTEESVEIWNPQTGERVHTLDVKGQITAVTLSPDRKKIAIGDADSKVQLWDSSGAQNLAVLSGSEERVRSLGFSQDAHWLVVARDTGGVELWDADAGEEVAVICTLPDKANWVVATPQGLYDGTDQAIRALYAIRLGTQLLGLSNLPTEFRTPGLLQQIFAGRRPKPPIPLATMLERLISSGEN
jgi:WD40 repeat protein